MNPEVKAQWVQALRSGEYEQGNGSLKTGDSKYCCLGVLCDIAFKQGDIVSRGWYQPSYSTDTCYSIDTGESAVLPKSVAEWAGIDSNPMVPVHSQRTLRGALESTLASLNDSGKSFQEIAQIIEEHL